MLSEIKTSAEGSFCPYAHTLIERDLHAPDHGIARGTLEMPEEEANLLRLYERVYWLLCVGSVMTFAAGVAIAARVGLVAGLVMSVLASGPFAYMAFMAFRRQLELRAYRTIPGPKPTFFLGNMKDLLACGHSGRDRVLTSLHAQFGPVVRLHLCWGSLTYVSISVPSRTLYRRDIDSVRRADRTLLPISLMGMKLGSVHQRHRRDLMPFLDRRAAHGRMPVVRELSKAYVLTWRKGGYVHDDLKADLMHWSAHCLGATLFGNAWNHDADLSRYLEVVGTFDEEVSRRTFHPFFSRWRLFSSGRNEKASAAYRDLYDFVDRLLEREAEPNTVHSRVRALETAGDWTHAEVVEELMSLVVGGTDAMASLVGQAMILLAGHPEIQDQARRAIAEGDSDEVPALLHNILQETMRIYPPVPFSAKFAHQAGTEQGHAIPAGTSLMWMKSIVGRNPELFEDPERFLPERFSASASPRQRESVRNAVPFGAGPRHCIGQYLGMAQCTAILAEMLSMLRLHPIPDARIRLLSATSVSPSTIPVRLEPIEPLCGKVQNR